MALDIVLDKTNCAAAKTAAGVLITFLVCFSGCSQDANSVTGQVKLDGNPLPDALVTFSPQTKGARIALSRTDENGNYRLKSSRNVTDVSPGSYKVEITTSRLTAGGDGEGKSPELVPPRFNKTTELLKEISPGPNQIDFDLQSE